MQVLQKLQGRFDVWYEYWTTYVVCLYVVDFVLRDPRESLKEPEPLALPAHREGIAVLPKPWHQSFVQAFNATRSSLHVTSPCMQQLQLLWFMSFRSVACVTYCRSFVFVGSNRGMFS